MGRALVAPVQRRRRSGELKSPGSRDLTPTVAFGQLESCESLLPRKAPVGSSSCDRTVNGHT